LIPKVGPSDGGFELAKEVLDSLEHEKPDFRFLYELDSPVKDKIEKLAKEIYGAKGVIYSGSAERDIRTIEKQGLGGLPICTAKTQLSLTDDPALRGAPTDWELNVREVRVSAGAGFIVPLCGQMMTMPGLPKHPAAENVDIDDEGNIVGLF
jgi:formate--tetrahydrofolate ligase